MKQHPKRSIGVSEEISDAIAAGAEIASTSQIGVATKINYCTQGR